LTDEYLLLDVALPWRAEPTDTTMRRPSPSHPFLLTVLLCLAVVPPRTAAQDAKPLAGVALRCCALVEAPTIVRDLLSPGTGNFSGLGILYLQELQARLGFTCSSITEYTPLDPDQEGFSGFVRHMGECAVDGDSSACDCDVGVAGIAQNPARIRLVDQVMPFSFGSLAVVQKMSAIANSQSSRVFFLAPFSPAVWVGVASIILVLMVITMIDADFQPLESSEQPAASSIIREIRGALLRNRVLRHARYAFFQTGLSHSPPPRAIPVDGKGTGF
jgi:hypothetical protein